MSEPSIDIKLNHLQSAVQSLEYVILNRISDLENSIKKTEQPMASVPHMIKYLEENGYAVYPNRLFFCKTKDCRIIVDNIGDFCREHNGSYEPSND